MNNHRLLVNVKKYWFGFLSVSLILAVAGFWLSLPNVNDLKGCLITEMNQVNLCDKNKSYIRYNQIPKVFIHALTVSEDASFFHHNGFDWYELKQSFWENIRAKRFKRGGSTLTQQLAKNVFLNSNKSLFRKLREAYITYQLEKNFSKEEILEKYANVVDFGPGLFGLTMAAQKYFGKSASQLNVLEASFLVLILPNPSVYRQSYLDGSLTKYATQRLKIMLKRLWKYRKIPKTTYDLALLHLPSFPWKNLGSEDFTQVAWERAFNPPERENVQSGEEDDTVMDEYHDESIERELELFERELFIEGEANEEGT